MPVLALVWCWRASLLLSRGRAVNKYCLMSVNGQAVAQCGGGPAVFTQGTLVCSLYFRTCLLCLYRCVRMCAWMCVNGQMGRAQPQGLEKEWAYRGSILSHTLVLWPRPGQLWFPRSEAAAALIFSSKLYLSSKVNGQKSRHVGSADHSKEAAVAERQSRPRPINNPLSITTLTFIDREARDECAAFIWDKHKML